jgi:hypothetical protein
MGVRADISTEGEKRHTNDCSVKSILALGKKLGLLAIKVDQGDFCQTTFLTAWPMRIVARTSHGMFEVRTWNLGELAS